MQAHDKGFLFSSTDISNFAACGHLTQQERAAACGGSKRPKYDDPALQALKDRGDQHEQRVLDSLTQGGKLEVVTIERCDYDPANPIAVWKDGCAKTMAAMQSGAGLIYQGVLLHGDYLGRPDFLRKVDLPSDLGEWSYEIIDAKLSREAKARAVLQTAHYSELLGHAQGVVPELMYLALGGPEQSFDKHRVADYAAYFRTTSRRFEEAVVATPQTYPEPVEHCSVCDWSSVCAQRRHDDDHLSLVARISRSQRKFLNDSDVNTVRELARLPIGKSKTVAGIERAAFVKIREQARLQVEGRDAGEVLYELLDLVEGEYGFGRLPEPSPNDLFLDLEGAPHYLDEGLEYLFGVVAPASTTLSIGDGGDVTRLEANGYDLVYRAYWALNQTDEKAKFEAFIDLVMERRAKDPSFHIYHYNHYERTAFKRLMGRYATREHELDELLRAGVFVDLYRVVAEAVRVSAESYSIKELEPLYEYDRDVDLVEAVRARVAFEAALQLGTTAGDDDSAAIRDAIEVYNRDDCVSTFLLRDWLEARRGEAEKQFGEAIARPDLKSGEAGDELEEHLERIAQLIEALTSDVPVERDDRSDEQHARWLLAQLLEWHRREKKAQWWEYFRLLDLPMDELVDERTPIAGLTYEGVVETIKKSDVHRYRFPAQDFDIREGTRVVDPATGGSPGTVIDVDAAACTIDLKRAITSDAPHPESLIPNDDVNDVALRQSLQAFAEDVVERGMDVAGAFRCGRDILLRTAAPVLAEGYDESQIVAAARAFAPTLVGDVLPIQGPPGAGKTYTGSRMIVDMVRAGKTVGISATSHKVIGNLLDGVCEVARAEKVALRAMQSASADKRCESAEVDATTSANVEAAILARDVDLAAGTAWLWARPELRGAIDVLVVDEAGQVSLANLLAMAAAAKSVVLLGDPQQLEQPQKGSHPPGADASALEHLLGDTHTVSSDRGLFLDETWRLHPSICEYTSELFYDARLKSRPGCARQLIEGPAPFDGAGLRFVAVDHVGNRNESSEEVAVVAELVDALLSSGAKWRGREGGKKKVRLEDILIVAPYNAQVSSLLAALPDGARVGTVDKFQGQEAPIVIYSLATSSVAEAPRGMEFLFSPNRLNVATSRAQCVAVVVGSPQLFNADCASPRQIRLANAFCRYLEMAEGMQRGAKA